MSIERTILVTGGAGFIGSALVRALVGAGRRVVTIDALTYAGNPSSLGEALDDPRHELVHADIRDAVRIRELFTVHEPVAVIHLAAESHVDRSIDSSAEFVSTNVVGTHVMLEEARRYWNGAPAGVRDSFRFLHVSTDEVFGSLGDSGVFEPGTPYAPTSPYAASKAGSDHLARAWFHTYKLPVVVSNCSNNYGPYQFPEKLIPLMILKALAGEALPVYGRGENVRDWLHVEDHVTAFRLMLEQGVPGETYLVGGHGERRNIEVVQLISDILDELRPDERIGSRRSLMRFVTDRPGHDLRYAGDPTKVERELGWRPSHTFESGLRSTVEWYLANEPWWRAVESGTYRGERLGLAPGA